MIENDFFIIFVDSILSNRIYFTIRIVIKRPIDYIFVYIELFSLKFEYIENKHYCNRIFIKSMISMRYSLQCLYQIQIE